MFNKESLYSKQRMHLPEHLDPVVVLWTEHFPTTAIEQWRSAAFVIGLSAATIEKGSHVAQRPRACES